MRTIIYELNEVPRRLFDFYADAFSDSAFNTLRHCSNLFETHTADVGHLSPWITWPTMHRGVSNIDHGISDLGQNLREVNLEYPPLWETLAQAGVKVGMFGSLQSYPLPSTLDNYAFYVPDTFAAGPECYPQALSDFQAFNLSMVKASGRNVSSGIAVRQATKFLMKATGLGLSARTAVNLARQIVNERLNGDRVVRRRSSQIEIAFDLFFTQLSRTRPDVSFFFTNHVASSMHRYWPTIFPGDYDDGKFESDWLSRWKMEIPHAVKIANYQLDRLITFSEKNDYKLIVASSMGQAAVEDVEPLKSEVLITDVKKLLSYIGVAPNSWEPRLAMAPRIVIKPLDETLTGRLVRLDDITVNGKRINYHITNTGDVRFDMDISNVEKLVVQDKTSNIDAAQIGVSNVDLQDASGSYAYHIPEGILIEYIPGKTQRPEIQKRDWKEVSVLDFAPSLLNQFNVQHGSYMKGENSIFNV